MHQVYAWRYPNMPQDVLLCAQLRDCIGAVLILLVHLRQVLCVSTHVTFQGANMAQVGALVFN